MYFERVLLAGHGADDERDSAVSAGGDAIQPRDGLGPVAYSMWDVGPLPVLVRHRVPCVITDPAGDGAAVTGCDPICKLDYQLDLGCLENYTARERARMWLTHMLRPATVKVLARVDPALAVVHQLSRIASEGVADVCFSPRDAHRTLYTLLSRAAACAPGQYVLAHADSALTAVVLQGVADDAGGAKGMLRTVCFFFSFFFFSFFFPIFFPCPDTFFLSSHESLSPVSAGPLDAPRARPHRCRGSRALCLVPVASAAAAHPVHAAARR
jgi:hypothetical protein